ncbi:formimidoylglutamase [Aliivibrio kagoshimensis]|uniref:formimidoylglutamase n=1 Tax=Aliivibrio kagoshimensis TaxID=2910230 RepID=UPI003D099DCB
MTHKQNNQQAYAPTDSSVWQGRIDSEDGQAGMRFHQKVNLLHHVSQIAEQQQSGVALLGFACDEGVKRNKGRVGAAHAPDQIRKALANTAWHHDCSNHASHLVDVGNVYCSDSDLVSSQKHLATHVETALNHSNKVIVLGGGHEIAWGTFQGLAQHFQHTGIRKPKIGIINFDAHFDLRAYSTDDKKYPTSSGTPFNQIANHCQQLGWDFNYACLGVSRASNTQALFSMAEQLGVFYIEDHQLTTQHLAERIEELAEFISDVDYLYLTIDIDVFSACTAPGVSAPAARGVPYEVIDALLQPIFNATDELGQAKLLVADLAEFNPKYDVDNQTAKVAARLTWDISRAMFQHNES